MLLKSKKFHNKFFLFCKYVPSGHAHAHAMYAKCICTNKKWQETIASRDQIAADERHHSGTCKNLGTVGRTNAREHSKRVNDRRFSSLVHHILERH